MNNTSDSKKSKNLLLSGVLVLTVGNILVKIIGAMLKVPLQHILGDNGMAYYNVAYDIYVWLYMVSTAGLPVAVSLLTSEARGKGNLREARKIFRVSLGIFVAAGLAGMIVMALGRGVFAKMYQFDASSYAILAIAPTLFFICIASSFRGYFQGYQNMTPTAISELIEAVGKLSIGILLATYAAKKGYPPYIVAAYTLVGLTVGVAIGMFYLVVAKYFFREADYDREFVTPDTPRMPVRSSRALARAILAVGIPITISASTMSFTNVLDGMILSGRLQSIGYSEEAAATAFGNYKTCAVTLFNLPPVLIYPISSALIPYLSAAIASFNKKEVRKTMNSSLRITSVIAFPCAVGLSVMAEPILKILFSEESAKTAAPLLSILAIGIVFISLLSVTNSFLQAHKLEKKPIVSMVAGAGVKLLSSFVLIGIPGVEMFGAPIGTCLCYLTAMMLNLYFMAKYLHYIPNVRKIFLSPLVSSLLCGLAAIFSYKLIAGFLGNKLGTLAAICIAAVIYVLAVFLFKGITEEDIRMIPKGNRIIPILQKLRLLPKTKPARRKIQKT